MVHNLCEMHSFMILLVLLLLASIIVCSYVFLKNSFLSVLFYVTDIFLQQKTTNLEKKRVIFIQLETIDINN